MKTPREILLKRHRPVDTKLDQMWNESLASAVAAVYDRRESPEAGARRAPLQFMAWKLWRELILPCRRIWGGLACAWVVIAMLNLASFDPSTDVASNAKPPSGEELRALIEQRQMLAQLIGPLSEPADTQKRTLSGPRSDRTGQVSAA
jgi:hypothetical protein